MIVIPPEPGRVPVKMWTDGVEVEESARQQLLNVASLPFVFKHVAVMPDVHWGMGATVGSVIPTKGAIVPAAVGVDIGCGMVATRTSLVASDLPSDLGPLRAAIERAIPHGRTNNGGPGDRGAWGTVPLQYIATWEEHLAEQHRALVAKHPALRKANSRGHFGTLGTGNHFVEVCLDEEQRVWVMLHSGSRGVGNRIGSYFIELAGKEMDRWHIKLPDPALGYLPEGHELFSDYIEALTWAQRFAYLSRAAMLDAAIRALRAFLPPVPFLVDAPINCHHNYTTRENHFGENVWVTRKGAICARPGVLGIIPGSMGAKSYIVRGRGWDEAFHSCSHGAGRRMSRGEARRTFSLADHAEATRGVECRKDADVLDETPGAYKDIDAVMAAQTDLVDVEHTLKQVLCVKG